jgi:hypothetical protein
MSPRTRKAPFRRVSRDATRRVGPACVPDDGYTTPPPPAAFHPGRNGLATASLVCGIGSIPLLCLCGVGLVFALGGIGLGIAGIVYAGKIGVGRSYAIAGRALSALTLLLMAGMDVLQIVSPLWSAVRSGRPLPLSIMPPDGRLSHRPQ